MSCRRGSSYARAAFVAVLGGASLLLAAGPPQAARADLVDDHVAELQRALAGEEESAVLAKVRSLERKRDKRVDDALLEVVRSSKFESAARESMRVLGMHGSPAYIAWARSRLGDKKLRDDHPAQYTALLESLPRAGAALKPCLGALADCVSDHLRTRPEIARRAVVAYASAGSDKAVVQQLIDWLDAADVPAGGGRRGGLTSPPPQAGRGDSGGAPDTQGVKDEIQRALESMTGAKAAGHEGWKAWWAANKAGFKPSPPRAPEPDWDTLKEYADDTFDFVLRKPGPDAAWGFERCAAEGGRVCLRYRHATGVLARVDVVVRPKGRAADPAAFAASLAAQWKKSDFAEYFGGGEPAVSAATIGGREFAVLAARGVGTGAWKDWDACERRTYVCAATDDRVLCFEAVAAVGFTEAQKTAFWKDIEGVTFLE